MACCPFLPVTWFGKGFQEGAQRLDPVDLLLVAAGGAVGGAGRYWVSETIAALCGDCFPWGTLAVNTSGALAVGAVAAVLPPGESGAGFTLLVTGLAGSYTTVSAFSLQTLHLLHEGRMGAAAANALGSVGLSVAAAALGFVAMTGLLPHG